MIKTDYKPKFANKPIFSSSRKRSSLPVIWMVLVALLLTIWGLWSQTGDQTETDSSLEVSEQPLTIEQPKETLDTENDLQEIKLDFQHDKNTTNSQNKQSRPTKKQNTDVKPSQKENTSASTSKETPQVQWKKTKIRSGDSMARIFKRLGFEPSDLHAIISLGSETEILKNVKPGKILEYYLSPTNQSAKSELSGIRYTIDQLNTLLVNKVNDEWIATRDSKELEIRLANAKGFIESSLFLAGKKAGLTDAIVMELAGIFGWDIDFILDIREDDQFTVIYEEKYVEGDKIGNRYILAAEFVNQGKVYQSVRYTDSSGRSEYYTPAGMSMRKAFLRAPVDFSYISSNFKPRRFHPILKRVKAHNGVDYRAPKGTPVKASGDGKVITSAYSKYNGHHVFIQHGQKYITKYLHFTKRTVKRGQKVKQGQLIGYVGATGLAQAPHLHYEFLVDGVHRNPRTIKLPDAKPINSKEKQQFIKQTQNLVKQLEVQGNAFTAPTISAD